MGRKSDRMTISNSYSTYKREAGVYALPRAVYCKMLRLLFRKIMRRLIEQAGEWHLPMHLGLIYIHKYKIHNEKERYYANAARENGELLTYSEILGGYGFMHRWECPKHPARIPGWAFWDFEVTEDRNKQEIGKRGLSKQALRCAKDPKEKDYDAPLSVGSWRPKMRVR